MKYIVKNYTDRILFARLCSFTVSKVTTDNIKANKSLYNPLG
jgi:hypothetical protein